MGDRRRGGLGSAAVRHRVAGVCCAAGALLAVAAGSPVHADIDDLIDTVLNAATAGVDQADGALAGFSPDSFVPADFDLAALIPGDIAAPDDLATALAGAADPGVFADPFGQLEQAFAGGDTSLRDAMHELDQSWINADPTGSDHALPDGLSDGPTESHGGEFLYGDTGDHGDSGSAASADTPAAGHSADGVGTQTQDGQGGDAQTHDGQSSGQSGDQNGNQSGSSSNQPKLTAPSLPKGGSGGSGGGGNGGSGNNSNAKNNRSATRVPGSTLPYGP